MKQIALFLWFAAGLIFVPCKSFGQQQMSREEIKTAVVSMQKKIVDLTYSLEPFNCKEFVLFRNHISKGSGEEIVSLIKEHQFTPVQSDIGLCLLSGLDETNYWVTTAPLLSTNTPDEVISDILSPALPYGPGFANAYTHVAFTKRLLRLEADTASSIVKTEVDDILSGRAANLYKDYLKNPERYNYSKAQVDSAKKQ